MTRTEYRKHYNEILKKTVQMLKDYREAALKSGALDLESATEAYRLPKNVLCAALQECRDQWAPPVRAGESRTRNLDEKEIRNIYYTTYPS